MNDLNVRVTRTCYDERDMLYHSGVKDMRWHVRRYQNEDGSLTPLGRIHYGIGAAREKAKVKRTDKYIKEVARGKNKNLDKLSNDELNVAVERANAIRQIKSGNGQQPGFGKKIKDATVDVAVTSFKSAASKYVTKKVNELFTEKEPIKELKLTDLFSDKVFSGLTPKDIKSLGGIEELTKLKSMLKDLGTSKAPAKGSDLKISDLFSSEVFSSLTVEDIKRLGGIENLNKINGCLGQTKKNDKTKGKGNGDPK